jgi:signal transduction histidine kinase
VESAGYFTVAEALTNAVKHADASRLLVRLTRADDLLTIEVADDGVGQAGGGSRGLTDRAGVADDGDGPGARGLVDPAGAPRGTRGAADGSGLRGIADRVEALGGRLWVDSVPGRGTRLVAELPCAS